MNSVFSIYNVGLTALVTFLVSGVGGILLSRYLDRARPYVSLLSLSFSGNTAEISQETIFASDRDNWGPSMQKYVPYDELVDREVKATEIQQILRLAKQDAEEWIAKHAGKKQKILDVQDVLNCPYMTHDVVGSLLFGILNRRMFLDLPVSDQQLEKMEPIFDLDPEGDKGFKLHTGRASYYFRIGESYGPKEKTQIESIAKSFARGCVENVISVTKMFISEAAQNIDSLSDLKRKLESDLISNSKLTFELIVSNSGGKPVAIEPFGSVELQFGKDSVSLRLAQRPSSERKLENDADRFIAVALGEKGPRSSGRSGKSVLAEPFLSKLSGPTYAVIPGGKSEKVVFETVDAIGKLGANSKKVERMLKIGGFDCSITARIPGASGITSRPMSIAAIDSVEEKSRTIMDA